ncbi:hypothetical protein E4T47_09431 [Aureobasidium subglaciale]|nr:hypothetical protein E4T47_09431 [Aureobasidium subglaciale]
MSDYEHYAMTAASCRTYWNAGMVKRAHGDDKISSVLVSNTESMMFTSRIYVTFVARICMVASAPSSKSSLSRVWPELSIYKRYWTHGFGGTSKFAKTQDTANINLIPVNDCGIYVASMSKNFGLDIYIGLC